MGLNVEQVNPSIPRLRKRVKRVFRGHREGEHGGRILLPQVHRGGHRDPHPGLVSTEDVAGDPTEGAAVAALAGPGFLDAGLDRGRVAAHLEALVGGEDLVGRFLDAPGHALASRSTVN